MIKHGVAEMLHRGSPGRLENFETKWLFSHHSNDGYPITTKPATTDVYSLVAFYNPLDGWLYFSVSYEARAHLAKWMVNHCIYNFTCFILDKCDIDKGRRIECGKGIPYNASKSLCLANGCCYIEALDEEKQCYRPTPDGNIALTRLPFCLEKVIVMQYKSCYDLDFMVVSGTQEQRQPKMIWKYKTPFTCFQIYLRKLYYKNLKVICKN